MRHWFWFIILFFYTYLPAEEDFTDYSYELSICAIFQDEDRFLKEWIDFHCLVGVEHFYLFNNLSSDDYQNVLQPYIDTGVVELIDWPYPNDGVVHWNDVQCGAYKEGIALAKGKSRWLAIIDTDEFIVPVQEDDLPNILSTFNDYAGIRVNWQMYGTAGIAKIPSDKLLIESLLMKAPTDYWENAHVKTIVQPDKVDKCQNPHYVTYLEGCFSVNENREVGAGPINLPVSVSTIRINHYWTRDEEFFFERKIPRNTKWGGDEDKILERAALMNAAYDPIMLRFVPLLRIGSIYNNCLQEKNDG